MQAPILAMRRPGWVAEFQSFIMRGNVVDLAVGIIIGAAFTGVVGSLVKDLFNPIVGLLIGGIDFANLFVTLKGQPAPSLEAAKAAGAVTLNIGVFLNAVIQFLIVAFAVFWIVRLLNAVQRRAMRPILAVPVAPPPPSAEQVLLTEIRDLLARRGVN